MTFAEIVEQLRDGKRYAFSHPALHGHFHKAPYPSQEGDTRIDGCLSALTFWRAGLLASPVLLLDDFDRDDWELDELDRRHHNSGEA